MKNVVIADLGTGNLRSVSKAVTLVSDNADVSVSADTHVIESADYFILPGQGAIGTWFNQLNNDAKLKTAVFNRLNAGPVLGICLGLQALYDHSDENGGTTGLGVLPGTVKHFSSHPNHKLGKLKIPHIGWNQVKRRADHPLWHGIADNEYFYFVHSYYAENQNSDEVMGECQYGNEFTAAAATKNLFATQFHPEKSQQAGLQLLKNFVNWNGST